MGAWPGRWRHSQEARGCPGLSGFLGAPRGCYGTLAHRRRSVSTRRKGWRGSSAQNLGRGSNRTDPPAPQGPWAPVLRGAPASCRGAETQRGCADGRRGRRDPAPGPCLLSPAGRRRLRCWTATFCSPRTWTTPAPRSLTEPAPLQYRVDPAARGARAREERAAPDRGRGRGRGPRDCSDPFGVDRTGVL